MIDLEKGSEQIDKASGFFTKLNGFIKKHPIWFGIILIAGFFYWASTLPEEVAEEVITQQQEAIPQSAPEHKEEYVIIKKTYLVDDYGYRMGDTVYVDYYDDGYIEKYYTDGEEYIDDYTEE